MTEVSTELCWEQRGDFLLSDCGYVTKEPVSNGSWTSWCTYEGIEYPQEVEDAIESLSGESSSE